MIPPRHPGLPDMVQPARHRSSPIDALSLHVLIVEDDLATASLLQRVLGGEGMATEVTASGAPAIEAKFRGRPDVALIGLGPHDLNGIELMARFARDGDCGIIVLAAHGAEAARVAALDLGADDYVAKPPPPRELAARIRAVHRRLSRPASSGTARPGGVTLDYAYRRLAGPGRLTTALTEAEFAALATLLDADGASVSREWLGRVALKRPLAADDRSVDQLVLKLRRKLSRHGVTDRSILSSRGLGYVIPEPARFAVSPGEPRGDGTEAQDRG